MVCSLVVFSSCAHLSRHIGLHTLLSCVFYLCIFGIIGVLRSTFRYLIAPLPPFLFACTLHILSLAMSGGSSHRAPRIKKEMSLIKRSLTRKIPGLYVMYGCTPLSSVMIPGTSLSENRTASFAFLKEVNKARYASNLKGGQENKSSKFNPVRLQGTANMNFEMIGQSR